MKNIIEWKFRNVCIWALLMMRGSGEMKPSARLHIYNEH